MPGVGTVKVLSPELLQWLHLNCRLIKTVSSRSLTHKSLRLPLSPYGSLAASWMTWAAMMDNKCGESSNEKYKHLPGDARESTCYFDFCQMVVFRCGSSLPVLFLFIVAFNFWIQYVSRCPKFFTSTCSINHHFGRPQPHVRMCMLTEVVLCLFTVLLFHHLLNHSCVV